MDQRHRVASTGQPVGDPTEPRSGVATDELLNRIRTDSLVHRVVHVVAIAQAIHQTGFERLVGEQRCPVDEGAHTVGVEVPVGGDAADDLIHHRLDDAPGCLAVGIGEPTLGEQVGSVLVFVPLGELRCDAGLVERPAQERHLDGDACETHIAGGLQPDLVAERRQVVADAARVELAERLGPRDGELALAAEIGDRLTKFLGPPGLEHRTRASRLDDQRSDPGVASAFAQAIERHVERRLAASQGGAQRVGGDAFDQRLGEVELEDEVRRAPASRLLDPVPNVSDGLRRAREHAVEAMTGDSASPTPARRVPANRRRNSRRHRLASTEPLSERVARRTRCRG